MAISDLVGKNDDDLHKELLTLKKEQFALRFQQANMQLTNTARVRQVRREIARIKMLQGQRRAEAKKEA